MEKIVSISALLEKEKDLCKVLEKFQSNLQKDVTSYKQELTKKLKEQQKIIELYASQVRSAKIYIYKCEDLRDKLANDFCSRKKSFKDGDFNLLDFTEDFMKTCVENMKQERFMIEEEIDRVNNDIFELEEEMDIANDICKTLQYKLNLTDDELISLEINELKKQLIKVRTEISKQLCLKV